MSRSVNMFALFGIFSIAACVAMTPEARPQQQQDNMPSSLGCGAVNFVVTTYLPRLHADSFCSAFLQIPQESAAASSPSSSSHNDGHSLLPESTQKAFRQVTIPEFNWLRERQVQGSPRETLVGKACGCLQTPQTSSVLPAVQTIAAVDSAARPSMREGDAISTHLAPSQYQTELTHISRGNYGSTAVTSPPQSQATTYVAADLLAFMDPAERQLRMMSKRLGLASRILMDGGVVPVFNGSMTDFVGGGGRLGLVRALGSM